MSDCRSRPRADAGLPALATLIVLASGPAHAASPSASIGYDFYRGPSGQQTHAIVGLAGLGSARATWCWAACASTTARSARVSGS